MAPGERVLVRQNVRTPLANCSHVLFPQTQQAFADFNSTQASANTANPLPRRFFNDAAVGLNLSWELDFWGRFRRGVEAFLVFRGL